MPPSRPRTVWSSPVPPRRPSGQGRRLTIAVIADLHAGGPNMGLARVAQVVDAANTLQSDLIVMFGDYFATHRFVTEVVPLRPGRPNSRGSTRRSASRRSSAITTGGTTSTARARRWPKSVSGDGKRCGVAGRTGPPLLACRPRRPDRLSAWPGPVPGRRRSAGNVRHQDRRPGHSARARARYFHRCTRRVALTLAGHTHGGQIGLPLFRRSGRRRCMVRALPTAISSSAAAT